jgi:Polysaccharide pyruvyl transferase
MPKIAAVGVFALKNPGSVLIGDVLKTELERRLDGYTVDLHSLGDTPLSTIADPWDFQVTRKRGYTIGSFLSSESDSFVQRLVAQYRVAILGGDTLWTPHHPWPSLFWLDNDALFSSPLTVLSHAVCIREPFHFLYDERGVDYWRARFTRLCDRLAYVSVRDQRSRQTLEQLGITKRVHVVPEPVLFYQKRDNPQIARILERLGIDRSKPLVGVSLSSELSSVQSNFLAELLKGLRHLAQERGCNILAFAYSPVHHQKEGMVLLDSLGLPFFKYEPFLDPWDTYDLIGNLDLLVVFPGFHAAVAAIAQNVPVLTADIYTTRVNRQLRNPRYVMGPCTKILQLMQTFNLEESYINPYVNFEPDVILHRLEFLLSSRRDMRATLARVRAEISDHFDRLADLILRADRAGSPEAGARGRAA